MKPYTFLMECHGWYNYLDATVAQGLQGLGHWVLGADGLAQNYCIPHSGEPYDLFIQCTDDIKTQVPEGIPTVYVWGDDSGQEHAPNNYPDFASIKADLIFVRDYRGGAGPKVFPLNFGVEHRYFCAHKHRPPKKLADRVWDVVFLGRWDNCPGRRKLLKAIQGALPDYNVLLDGHIFADRDSYWSQWVNGYCIHSESYFQVLADSRIILSPLGAGPDCARHWEALASGGIPLIQGMPTVQVPPALESGIDCLSFNSADEAIEIIRGILSEPESFQMVANTAYQHASERHSTVERARFVVNRCEQAGLLK